MKVIFFWKISNQLYLHIIEIFKDITLFSVSFQCYYKMQCHFRSLLFVDDLSYINNLWWFCHSFFYETSQDSSLILDSTLCSGHSLNPESIPFKLRKFACILSPKSSFLSSLSCLSGTSVIKMLRFLFWNFNYHLYSPINRWVYVFVFFVYYFFVPFIICFLLVPIFVSVFFFHVRYFINIKWFLALCSYLRLKQWMLIKAVCMCDEECRFLGFTVVW